MKIELSSPRTLIVLASSSVLLGVIIGVAISFLGNTDVTVEHKETVQVEAVKNEPKPLTQQELDDLHSSWLFSTSEESAVLVDSENGFKTITIGE
ncbi:MAG: hypothetical protein OEY87_03480 [Gammaproteobacteria bacterium]|nr:hypothetical protein [Gammaproteobacteria bacterium]MDH5735164.1 hypothetical protein [Gammaproteobacteria bacterium]